MGAIWHLGSWDIFALPSLPNCFRGLILLGIVNVKAGLKPTFAGDAIPSDTYSSLLLAGEVLLLSMQVVRAGDSCSY